MLNDINKQNNKAVKLVKYTDKNTGNYKFKTSKNQKFIDTIIIPTSTKNCQNVFIQNKCWWSVGISQKNIGKLKFCAAYQIHPVKAVTHIVEIKEIKKFNNTNKYIITFKSKPIQLQQPVIYQNKFSMVRGRRYTTVEKLLKAKNLNQL